MKRLLNKLYSYTYWTAFGLICIPLFFINLVLFVLTFPFDRNGVVVHLFSCFWSWLGLRINPLWSLDIRGRRNIKWGKTYVLVSNHQSYFDVIVLFCLFRPYKWLSKHELFKFPFIGWNMYLNRYISITRKDPDSRSKAFAACAQWLKRGMSVILFPEGTRSETGELREFHSGAFRLAIQEKVALIPIAIKGTRNILQKKSVLLGPGKVAIKVRVLEPIETANFTAEDVDKLQAQVRQILNATLENL